MGYLKHVYGDDMTPEERARLDHGELVEQIRAHGACLTSYSLQKFHDRHYGDSKSCSWCLEPQRENDAKTLKGLAIAFVRPSAEPEESARKTPTTRLRTPFGEFLLGDITFHNGGGST